MAAAVAQVHPPTADQVTWRDLGDRVVVSRAPALVERVRLAVALLITAAAIGFFLMGLVSPESGGFQGRSVLLWLTGPALVIAAALHLVLIATGIRRPLASFSAEGVQVLGFTLRREQVTGVWVERNPATTGSAEPIIMVGTTAAGLTPAIPATAPGMLPLNELNSLCVRVQAILDGTAVSKNPQLEKQS